MEKLACSVICIGLFLSFQCDAALKPPTSLTCEYVKDPSVVDVAHPRLGWINLADKGERGQVQMAYQIRVAGSKVGLSNPDLWDSGRVETSQSTRVVYQGKALPSQQLCWWQVRVWDREGQSSGWSKPAFWRMGLLHRSDWQAQWIGAPWQGEEPLPRPGWPGKKIEEYGPPAPMLRKTIALEKEIDQAVAYVTGLGYFEFYVNGQRVGEDVLVPNQTNYGKRPKLPQFLILGHETARPGGGIFDKRPQIGQLPRVGIAQGMADARVGNARHEIDIDIVIFGQGGPATVANHLHVDAFVIGGRIAVVDPQKGADLHGISRRIFLLVSVGAD